MNPKDTLFSRNRSMKIKGKIIDFSVPKVMGVLNVTPDSFYDGGRYTEKEKIVSKVKKMILEGVDFIDVGAYSSRPGAAVVSYEEEIRRLSETMKVLKSGFPAIIISIDTFRSGIARKMVEEYGADMINDISAGDMDKEMFSTIADLQIPYVMMHMQGTPQTMQKNPKYDNVVKDIITVFSGKVEELKLLGVDDVILDPGFGFGKTLDHNYELINGLGLFSVLNKPIMVGVSRKSIIGKLLGCTPDEALNGTVILNTVALMKGIDILRVHDVKEAVEAIKIVEKLKQVVSTGS
ncbi:MAG: dihydropteroate synthase [Bacteroidetes bacterium]|nr:dihydropteroate synthase [Bacteroidota bacterium]